ncbi:hypothetical protein ACM9HF_09015 [Colwellia sp. RE-S-Sl-9]
MSFIIPKKIPLFSLFFFLVIILLPVVDNLTGALFKLKITSENTIGSPSQIARFILFALVILMLDRAKFRSSLKIIIYAMCYLFLTEVFIACFHMNLKAFISGIIFSIKILFSLSCYYYVANWINYDRTRTIYVIKQLINYGTIVSLLVLTAYFSGFHISNYQIGIATRGLFISGNGLGVVLGVSTILLICFNDKITLRKFFHIVLLIITTALLGTKASLVFLLIALILLAYKLSKQSPIISAVAITILAIYLLPTLISVVSSVFENIIFKFNSIDNKMHFIASSRDTFIRDAFTELNTNGLYSFRVLFGGGAYYAYTDFSSGALLLRKTLENDLFELFFSYGIITVLIYVSVYFFALKKSLHKKEFAIALTMSLAFFHSITVGHVLFNGTSAITYVLCLAIATKGSKVNNHDF